MVFVASIVLLVFCDLFALDFQLCLFLVHGHATLFVVSYCYWFFIFFSCLFLVFVLHVFMVFGHCLGKSKVNGAKGNMNETRHVM